jgi:hypothetical protein
MPLTLYEILTVCARWYNVVWVVAFALATVETLLFHFATLTLLGTPMERPSYVRQMCRVVCEIPIDAIVFLLWFVFVALGSYPLSHDTRDVFAKGSDLVLGGLQSLAVSHLLLRHVFNRKTTKSYCVDLSVSLAFAVLIFGVYYAATKLLNIPPLNLTWFFLGLASYLLIIDRNAERVRRERPPGTGTLTETMWEDYLLTSQKDGAILFLILSLAINLFPALDKIHDVRMFSAGLAATVIAVATVMVDYMGPRSRHNYEKLTSLGKERQANSFANDFTTYCDYHVTIRSLILLMMGVVLVYNIASFKVMSDEQGSGTFSSISTQESDNKTIQPPGARPDE